MTIFLKFGFRSNDHFPNIFGQTTFVFGQMTFFGIMNFRPNGIRLNVVRSKGVSVKLPFGQMVFGQMAFGQPTFR
jgi:hypothetical protein